MTEAEKHWRRCFPDLYAAKLAFEQQPKPGCGPGLSRSAMLTAKLEILFGEVEHGCWSVDRAVERAEELILDELAAVAAAEREACALIVEAHQEVRVSSAAIEGTILAPRMTGNTAGLAFAKAIRARGSK